MTRRTIHSLFVAMLLVWPTLSQAAERHMFDKEHTTILFYINHLGFSDKIGLLTDYDGFFTFDKDKPEQSSVEVTFRPSGIKTGSDALDKELQSKDWFNAVEFPDITFKSTQVKVTGKNTADVTGWLSMLGKNHAITLKVTFNKMDVHPMTKKMVAGFSADTEFKRSQFGLINGIPYVGDTVRIHIETEGVQQSAATADEPKAATNKKP